MDDLIWRSTAVERLMKAADEDSQPRAMIRAKRIVDAIPSAPAVAWHDAVMHPPEDDGKCFLYCRGGAYNQLAWHDVGYYSNGKWYTDIVSLEEPNDHVTHWIRATIPPSEG